MGARYADCDVDVAQRSQLKLTLLILPEFKQMPFSSLSDPLDLARACAALDAAWEAVRAEVGDDEQARIRLSYIIASLVAVSCEETELVERAVGKFRDGA